MHDKRQVIGALAVLLVGVIAAVALWPRSSTSVAQGVGPSRGADAEPGGVVPLVSAGGEVPSAELPSPVRRELVEAEPRTDDAAARDRGLVVRGVVRNVDKEPVAQAVVRFDDEATVTSAADGSYEIAVRVRGDRDSLRLIAQADGWVASTKKVVVDGDELTADFALRPAGRLAGRVTDPQGMGIASAHVWSHRPLHRPVQTDAEGYFCMSDVDPKIRKLFLEVSARGYFAKGEVVQVAGEDGEGPVIELTPGAVVRGIVRGPDQLPVAGAALVITTGMIQGKYRLEAESDDAGRFEFSGVPRGRRPLDAIHGEFAASQQELDVPEPGQVLDVVVELSVGRTVRGVVRAAAGGPVAAATVNAFGPAYGGGVTLRGATADEQGRFELAGLPVEELRLACDAEGFVPARWVRLEAGAAYREIVLQPAARIAGTVVDALTGAPIREFSVRLRGDFESADKGAKGAGTGRVLRFDDEQGHWDTTAIPLAVGATADIEVSAEGRAPTVAVGLVARLDASYGDCRLALYAGVALSGTIATDAGVPIARAHLQLVPAGEKRGRSRVLFSRSDEAGCFAFADIAPGVVRIVVEDSGTGVFVHEERIPDGQREWHVAVRVTAQGEVRGTLRAADGRPADGVDMVLTSVEVPGLGGRQWQSKTNLAGQFVFRGLPFGVYRVARTESMVGKPLETSARHVAVIDRTPVEVDMKATGVATIRGTLIADFAVGDDALVQLLPRYEDDVPAAERAAPRFTRARNGVFGFEGVDAGPHRLRAWCRDPSADKWHSGEVEVEVEATGETRVDVTVANRPG